MKNHRILRSRSKRCRNRYVAFLQCHNPAAFIHGSGFLIRGLPFHSAVFGYIRKRCICRIIILIRNRTPLFTMGKVNILCLHGIRFIHVFGDKNSLTGNFGLLYVTAAVLFKPALKYLAVHSRSVRNTTGEALVFNALNRIKCFSVGFKNYIIINFIQIIQMISHPFASFGNPASQCLNRLRLRNGRFLVSGIKRHHHVAVIYAPDFLIGFPRRCSFFCIGIQDSAVFHKFFQCRIENLESFF